MKAILFFLISTSLLLAQSAADKPTVGYRLLYVDRPPTAAEVAAAEASDKPLEPTIYYLAANAEGKKPEFVPLFLPFSRLTSPVSLPAGSPLSLYSAASPGSKIAEISPGSNTQVIAVLKASRDQSFRDAKVEVLDASEKGFPFGQMRILNTSDRRVAIKTLDPVKQIEPGGAITFRPTPGRRDTVPVLAGVEEQGEWREFHSGATKVRANNRILLLVTGQTAPDGTHAYAVEYLAETAPTASPE